MNLALGSGFPVTQTLPSLDHLIISQADPANGTDPQVLDPLISDDLVLHKTSGHFLQIILKIFLSAESAPCPKSEMQTFHPGIIVPHPFLFLIQMVLRLQHYSPRGTRPARFSSYVTFLLTSLFLQLRSKNFIIIIIPSTTWFLSSIVLSMQNSDSR